MFRFHMQPHAQLQVQALLRLSYASHSLALYSLPVWVLCLAKALEYLAGSFGERAQLPPLAR